MGKLRFFLFVVLLGVISFAQQTLRPPVQSPATIGQEKKPDQQGKAKSASTPEEQKQKPTDEPQKIDPNWLIAVFTLALVFVGVAQFYAIYRQAMYMRYTVRPSLIVRNVEISVEDLENMTLKGGALQVYNSGNGQANLKAVSCGLWVYEELPMKHEYAGFSENHNIKLPPGFFGIGHLHSPIWILRSTKAFDGNRLAFTL